MAPIPHPDDHDKPNNGEETVDMMDVPDVVINADSSDSEGDGEFGYDGYQVLQQFIEDSDEDSDDEENEEDMTTDMTVEQGGERTGISVDAEVERSTTTDETSRLPPGLHTAGGTTPSYMKVNIVVLH